MSSPEPETPAAARLFQVNRTSYSKHYEITSTADNQILYWLAQSGGFTSKIPDLVLHCGPNNKSPVVAVSYMFRLQKGFKLGFGDPSGGDDAVRWEDMTMETRNGSEHRLHMPSPPGPEGDDKNQRKEFVWKRTHSAEVEGEKPKPLSMRNFKLLDPETDEVLAVYLNRPTYTKCGILQINVDRGQDFDVMVIISCLSMYEKSKRRAHGSPIGKDNS